MLCNKNKLRILWIKKCKTIIYLKTVVKYVGALIQRPTSLIFGNDAEAATIRKRRVSFAWHNPLWLCSVSKDFIRETMASSVAPRLGSPTKCTSSIRNNLMLLATSIWSVQVRVTASHFSGVVTTIWKLFKSSKLLPRVESPVIRPTERPHDASNFLRHDTKISLQSAFVGATACCIESEVK